LEDLGIYGKITSKWIFIQEVSLGTDWSHLPQDRDRWWALENVVMNVQVP
jgi:hypothetical protein